MIDITNKHLKKSYNQVKNELKNYSSKLSKRKELVVLNKTDLLDKEEIEEIVKNFSKSKDSEVVTLSPLNKDSVSKIKAKLLSYVS